MSDPDMGAWEYQYDGSGNLIAQKDGRDIWLHLAYDDLNRLTDKRRDTINGPLVSEYLYDSAYKGQLDATKAYDSSGGTVEVETQILGRDGRYRVTQQQWLINGEGSFKMAYGYNAVNNQTSIQYPAHNSGGLGETVTQSYNDIGQLDQVISQQDNTHFLDAISYTPTGQLSTLRLDQGTNGANFSYSYQPGSLRLQQKQVSSGGGSSADLQNLSYTYDDAGNISTITDGVNGNQTQTFGYDWLNRLTSAGTDTNGTGQYNHTYSYDSIGNITEFDGAAYTYDDDQPHAVTAAHGNQYCYDANANQVSRLIDGTLYSLTYDVENRLTGVSQVTNLTATIAKSGNDVQLSWSPIVSATSYELWRSSKPYFVPGDVDSEMIAEIDVTTHTDPNHIGDVDTNYVYQVIATNGGCPIAVSQQMGEFDFGIFSGTTLLTVPSVATEITFPEIVDAVPMSLNVTAIAEYVYDADGNRVKGTVNGVTTIYIAGIFEYQAGAITKYYPGAGGSSAMRRENYASDNGIYYILGDHLGSTSTIIQQNTAIVKQEYYYPFGGNRGSTFSEITTKRFTGQYHETSLPGGEGLSYYNARWYDAQLGRFLSADTLIPNPANPQAFNRLSYVGNNPLRFIDPSGHRECEGTGNCAPPPRPPRPSSSNSGSGSPATTNNNQWRINRRWDVPKPTRLFFREKYKASKQDPIFSGLPLQGDISWANGFGATEFAMENATTLYSQTSGLHGGIDLGGDPGQQVLAQVMGIVIEINIDSGDAEPNIVVQVGQYLITYGHTENTQEWQKGDQIGPLDVVGTLQEQADDNTHLHLVVQDETGRVYNPVNFFNAGDIADIPWSSYSQGQDLYSISSYMYSSSINYWTTTDLSEIGIR